MPSFNRKIVVFFFQAEDGIRDLVRSRGLGDVYKRQAENTVQFHFFTQHESLDIRILDLSGKEMLKREFIAGENPEMDTRDLSSGMYLVQMRSGKFLSTKKLTIVN